MRKETKLKISSIVKMYTDVFIAEFNDFKFGMRQKRSALKDDKFAQVKDSDFIERALYEMPETLFEAVAYHHDPRDAKIGIMETCLVHMANIFTDEAEQGLDMQTDKPLQEVNPFAWEITGLDESVKEHVFREAGPLFTEALETILPRSYPSY